MKYDARLANIVSRKGAELFSYLKMITEPQDIDEILSDILVNHRFAMMPINDFTHYLDLKTGKEISPFVNNWLYDTSTSAFLFGDIRVSSIHADDRERFFVRFPVVNNGNGDGIITVGIREQPQGGTVVHGSLSNRGTFSINELETTFEKTFNIAVGQTMEIGFLCDSEPRELIINTYLAQNLPTTSRIQIDNINEEKISGFEGIRPYNGAILTAKPYEFIVDNEDAGFSILNKQEKNTMKDWWMSRILPSTDDKYQIFNQFNASNKWQFTLNSTYYGNYIKSAVCKRAGTGDNNVRWEIELPESGNYSTYVYIPIVPRADLHIVNGRRVNYKDGSFFYIIEHDDGKDTVEIDIPQHEGWYFLGDFYISKGLTSITLSDKTNFGIVVADAVKWVKK
jgi:hypothetical protein